MFLGALVIGLREGLEAALVISLLLAFLRKRDRLDASKWVWLGVGVAIAIAVAVGAFFTFGTYQLSFTGQELVGGVMSLLAVAMITWMALWLSKTGSALKTNLEASATKALGNASTAALFWIALVAVGREGLETTLLLWGWAMEPAALAGALIGIGVSAALGFLMYRGMLRLNLGRFFSWTGVLLIVLAAGVLAYAIGDLQEAAVLPGPFSGHPITPTDLRTGEVLVGPTDGPFWLASFPFGWAWDVTGTIDPTGALAAVLQGTVGFMPKMSWLAVIGWATYLLIVLPRLLRANRARKLARTAKPARAGGPSASASPPDAGATPAPGAGPAADDRALQPST